MWRTERSRPAWWRSDIFDKELLISEQHSSREVRMQRAIITVVGKDTIGIIAGVCSYLAENRINILDISQTIVQGYFNMMMVVDVTTLEKPFGQIADELAVLGREKIGVQIKCQKEEIFDLMHRI